MMMKSTFAALACLVASACAQIVSISSPSSGDTFVPESSLEVQLYQPTTETPFTDSSVVIAIQSCEDYSSCSSFDASQALGILLYNGLFDKTSFTVTIPGGLPKGPAVLTATSFGVLGSGPKPFMQTANVTVYLT